MSRKNDIPKYEIHIEILILYPKKNTSGNVRILYENHLAITINIFAVCVEHEKR